MKANKFIKKFGLVKSKAIVGLMNYGTVNYDGISVDYNELKRLVESHELVESYGGLEEAKSTVNYPNFLNDEDVETTKHRLSKAIEDVESCILKNFE